MISHCTIKILVSNLIFGPTPLIVKFFKEALDRQSLTTKILILSIACQLRLSMYKVLLDSNKYLLSYIISINSLQPDVHDMKSQILIISLDFTQTSIPFFRSFSKSLNLELEKIFRNVKRQSS